MTWARIGIITPVLAALACTGCDSAPSAQANSTSKTSAPAAVESPAKTEAPTESKQPSEEETADKSFDDIKFEMEKTDKFERSMITPEIEKIIDRKIRIRGYMYPTLKKRGLTQFILVRDNLECCFGPGAALYDCILIYMNEGKTAEYSIRPIAVEGTFRFEEVIGPDENHLAIYRLDAESAE